MNNPFAYIADPIGIHWGWVALASWLILYLLVRNFIGWLAVGFLAIGFLASVAASIIAPDAGTFGEHLWSWGRLFAMLLIAGYLPHLLLILLGLAGDGVRAGDYDGDGH